jgi:hypothetical protein
VESESTTPLPLHLSLGVQGPAAPAAPCGLLRDPLLGVRECGTQPDSAVRHMCFIFVEKKEIKTQCQFIFIFSYS